MKKLFVFVVLMVGAILISCNSSIKDKIIGEWRGSNMETDIPNVPELLIKNARIISLSTNYVFNDDGSYVMTVSKNELEGARKQEGKYILDEVNKTLELDTEKLLFEEEDEWVYAERNDYNNLYFNQIVFTIEKVIASQLVISEEGGGGKVYFTLDKVQ